MPGFPSDRLIELDQSACSPGDGAFSGGGLRSDVQVDVAREIEAYLDRRRNRRSYSKGRHRRSPKRLALVTPHAKAVVQCKAASTCDMDIVLVA
jgi:hypothetical protein